MKNALGESNPLEFTVYGHPAPQGSKRHVGKGVMVESSKKVKPWREAVKWAALAARGNAPPMDEPLHVIMTFTLPKPASAPKTRRTMPMRKPDIDKLIRSTMDALTDAGVWADDSRVVSIKAVKTYPNEHPDALDHTFGARISIEPVVP